MDFRILRGDDKEFDISFLPKIMEVDKVCYKEEYVGTLSQMEARYKQNNRTFVCVMDGDEVAGYINFFPVKSALWDEIVETGMKIRDDDIMPDELAEYSATEWNRLFIISVAVKEESNDGKKKYRDQGVVRLLTDAFIDYLNQLEAEGYKIGAIAATAVSEDGKKFLRTRMFGVYREIEGGNVVYTCDSIYLKKFLQKDFYFKSYQDDVYLFLPYADNEKNTRIDKLLNGAHDLNDKSIPAPARYLLKALENCLIYEYQSDMVNELERVYIGERMLLHTLDNYGDVEEDEEDEDTRPRIIKEEDLRIVGEEKVYISLFAHHASHMYIAMLFIPNSKYSASQLEDQMCQSYLLVREPGDKDEKGFYQYVDLDDYLREEYGLIPCGKGKTFLCMSEKPQIEKEILNILSAETYYSIHQDFHISYPQLMDEAAHNHAVYDYYETYMTNEAIAFILYDFADKVYEDLESPEALAALKARVELTATYVFIAELVIFQNTALNKMTAKVSNAMALEGDVPYEYIIQLYQDYAKSMRFWQSDSFKYYGTKKEAELIKEAFDNEELKQSYSEQQEFLEHMAEIKSAEMERKNGFVINFVATILAILQVKDYVVDRISRFYDWSGVPIKPESADNTFNVLFLYGGALALLVIYIRNKKRAHLRKKKLSEIKEELKKR